MNLGFEVRFHSTFGQQLFILGNHPLLGGGDPSRAVPLRYKDPETWDTTIWVPEEAIPDETLTYDYVLREPDGTVIHDWGVGRSINPAEYRGRGLKVIDAWNYAGFFENAFYTESFQRVLLKSRKSDYNGPRVDNPTHRFTVRAPLLEKHETLCLLGSAPTLADWDTTAPVLMSRSAESPFLTAEVRLAPEDFPLQYKYGVFNHATGSFVRYEGGQNRWLTTPPTAGEATLVRDAFTVLPSTNWKGAGVAIPVFSLRSEQSFGIGEFNDLKPLADWCVATGLKLIQILPVNDTTATKSWKDSYPYSAISAFALHPVYLRLADIARDPKSQEVLRELENERQRLNRLPAVGFEEVLRTKLEFIERVFPLEKKRVLSSDAYRAFYAANARWLVPYAVFCCLRDKYKTSDFNQWPAHGKVQLDELKALADSREMREGIELACFTQFHLHAQLQSAADYAHEKGVILKGDIPIGVFRYGADAWEAREQFNMQMQSGAPPDPFSETGQNWEFPTYNWRHMRQDGYAWWKMRFTQMSHYFDAFRIDHILGFFRIWSIPRHAVQGMLGYFVPALPVRRAEFEALGIPFDEALYLQPRITDKSLEALFGSEAESIAAEFLDLDQAGNHQLKPQFKTQRQVEQLFAGRTDSKSLELRNKLFGLIADVLLLQEEGRPGVFHFRFNIEGTSLYQEFEPDVQAKLKSLYVDYFFRRQEDFWMREALEKLPALKRSTSMLICGEDLGMVPACVPQVMRDLGLLSLEIQRMPKNPATAFFRPADAPYLSVVSPSTHDMSTIRGWWEEDETITQEFYKEELRLSGPAPAQCTADINRMIVQQHLNSPAMWSIFQLQDLLGSDEGLRRPNPHEERINIPADPAHRWSYRMHLTLEQLQFSRAFNERLREAVAQAGR
jgi:4-alpha-glucanotransferase